jgi:hypothetical protein
MASTEWQLGKSPGRGEEIGKSRDLKSLGSSFQYKKTHIHTVWRGCTNISLPVFQRMSTPMSPRKRKSCSRVGSTIFGSHLRMLKVTQTGLYSCSPAAWFIHASFCTGSCSLVYVVVGENVPWRGHKTWDDKCNKKGAIIKMVSSGSGMRKGGKNGIFNRYIKIYSYL